MILQSKFVTMILDFFGHVTHQDLVKQINDGTRRLNVNKLIQISMDGQSVNHKFFKKATNSINLLILLVVSSALFVLLLKRVPKMSNGI